MSFFDVDHPLTDSTVGSWSNVDVRPVTAEELRRGIEALRNPPPRRDPVAIVSPAMFDALMRQWQRHPTRRHFYLCRVHSDCRPSAADCEREATKRAAMSHACWLAQGRVSGDARPLGALARLGMKARPTANKAAMRLARDRYLMAAMGRASAHFDAAFGKGAAALYHELAAMGPGREWDGPRRTDEERGL